MPDSSLYIGAVTHRRRVPVENGFRYGVYFTFLDIDNVQMVADRLRLFSYNRAGVFSFHDKDHGPRTGEPLRPWIDETLSRAGIELEGGRVFLLTFPRVLGTKFYPVSFWYCYHADGTVRAVLAEVQNTFREHHNYLLHQSGDPLDWTVKPTVTKVFYVSPFIEMDARYEFRLSEPRDRLGVSIYDFVKGPLLLTASIDLKTAELSDRNLMQLLFRYGPMSARAWLLIHAQAVRIVSKRIPYVPKKMPPPVEETTI
jgi:uncharacterized protein